MLEKVTTDESTGQQVSLGTWDYKPPALKSIPVQLNVTLANVGVNPSPLNVLGSKAVGEPPFTLSNSVFFAIVRAIKAARVQTGQPAYFDLEAPLTCEKIQQSCGVDASMFVL
jgi:xanthine dehydrogenase/oxidase